MKILSVFLKFIFYITLPMLFLGCASYLLKANERLDIQSGKQTLILLRITCESEDGTPMEPFWGSVTPGDWFFSKNTNEAF